METVKNGTQMLEQLLKNGNNAYLTGTVTLGLAALGIVVGLLICFFGVKILKVLAAIFGLSIGAGVGAVIGTAANVSSMTMAIIVLIAAVVGAVLLVFLRRLSALVVVFAYALSICVMLLVPQSTVMWIICVVVPVILAILAAVFVDPMVIILTGVSGGLSVGVFVAGLLNLGNKWIGYGIGLAIAVIGIIVQFVMYSKKQGKKDKQRSKKAKAVDSRETEVEKARRLLENSDDELDEYLDELTDDDEDALEDIEDAEDSGEDQEYLDDYDVDIEYLDDDDDDFLDE